MCLKLIIKAFHTLLCEGAEGFVRTKWWSTSDHAMLLFLYNFLAVDDVNTLRKIVHLAVKLHTAE